MPNQEDLLIAKRDALIEAINEHYYFIIELSRWLSPPILETLTPQQIEEYQETIIFYIERLQVWVDELTDTLGILDSFYNVATTDEVIRLLDDVAYVINKIIDDLPGEIDIHIDPPIGGIGDVIDDTIGNVNLAVEITLKEDQGFWDKLMDDLGDFVTAPLDWLIEQGEQFTLDLMGIMFVGLIDLAGEKMSGFIENAVGTPIERGT